MLQSGDIAPTFSLPDADMADFDLATGTLDIRPFNLYALVGAGGGVVSSALASVALLRGWGRK